MERAPNSPPRKIGSSVNDPGARAAMKGEETTAIYPEFLTCIPEENSAFWRSIFLDLSNGVCPPGSFFYKDAYIGCKWRGKLMSIGFRDRVNEVLRDDVINLLQEYLNIKPFSESEKDSYIPSTGLDIKRKSSRLQLLQIFTADSMREHSLSLDDALTLLNELHVRISYKLLTQANVCYSKGRISSIEGLSFTKGRYAFSESINTEIEKKENILKHVPTPPAKTLEDVWKKM